MEGKNHQVVDLTIVLPTYNESLTVEKILDSILRAVPSKINTEVLVIDDNSPDGTGKIVNSYIQKSKAKISFKIHTRKDKRGLSSAIIDGINLACGKFIVVMDCDFSHPPEKILVFYNELTNNEFDIVIGSRYVKGGMIEGWPLNRKLISKIGCSLAKLWFGLDVNDSMSGFFALKKNLIRNLSFEAIGYKILLEILVKTKGVKVKEIPFVFKNRQEGASKFKFSLINDYFRLLKILKKNTD